MGVRTLTRIAGLLGGLAWLGCAVLDSSGATDSLVNALHWGGLALIAIALVGIGGGLVSGVWAVRLIVAVCLPALVWAILEWLHEQYVDRWVDGSFGVLFGLFCLAGLAARGNEDAAEQKSGSHAR